MESKRKLIMLGGGGHCLSAIDIAERMHIFDEIVIVDPGIAFGTDIMGHKVVGGDDKLADLYKQGYRDAFVTVGSIKSTLLRHSLYEKAEKIGFIFPNIIDPSAIVSEHADLSQGIFVGKKAVINSMAAIDQFAIINTDAVIEHNCKIGSFSHVAVGTKICGDVHIGNDCLIGAGTTIIQGIKIGDNTIIGAGSVIINDIESNRVAVGVPAKPIKMVEK